MTVSTRWALTRRDQIRVAPAFEGGQWCPAGPKRKPADWLVDRQNRFADSGVSWRVFRPHRPGASRNPESSVETESCPDPRRTRRCRPPAQTPGEDLRSACTYTDNTVRPDTCARLGTPAFPTLSLRS